jgi:hypothetical protein
MTLPCRPLLLPWRTGGATAPFWRRVDQLESVGPVQAPRHSLRPALHGMDPLAPADYLQATGARLGPIAALE